MASQRGVRRIAGRRGVTRRRAVEQAWYAGDTRVSATDQVRQGWRWAQREATAHIERILRDYVIDLCAEFVALHGDEQGFENFAAQLQKNLAAIVKRLGGERYQRLAAILDSALEEQQRSGNVDLHRGWIEGLLNEYYDPMYVYQRQQKAERVIFSGDQHAVADYLRMQQTA